MTETTLKLGKTPARHNVKFKLTDFLDVAWIAPKIPTKVGHAALLAADVGMLGNDTAGDCVWAGAGHEHMLWERMSQETMLPSFSTQATLSDYSAVTGYNPADPNTDQGTDMQVAAKYRQKTGILDASGKRHKIGAYLAIDHTNSTEMAVAIHLFGSVGLGIEFPEAWMDAFQNHEPWGALTGAKAQPAGGHYIPLVQRTSAREFEILTWGRAQKLTLAGLHQFADEALAYIPLEALNPTTGKTIDGFDAAALNAAIAGLPKD